MEDANEVPLIYTKNGNMPVLDLRLETRWTFTEDVITFEELYYDGEEIVRHSVHKYGIKPLPIMSAQSSGFN